MNLTRLYHCETAHQLTAGVPEGHPCRRLHGHRYEIEITIGGLIQPNGMIREYAELDAVMLPLIDLIDHRFLNELGFEAAVEDVGTHAFGTSKVVRAEPLGFEFRMPDLAALVRLNPTVEHLALWLWNEILLRTSRLSDCWVDALDIREDSRSKVSMRREVPK